MSDVKMEDFPLPSALDGGNGTARVKREGSDVEDIKPSTRSSVSRANSTDFWAQLQAEASSSRSPSPDRGNSQRGDVKRESNPSRGQSESRESRNAPNASEEGNGNGNVSNGGNGGNGGTPGGKRRKDASSSAAAAKREPIVRPLIDNLPLAWDEAHETFRVLEQCVYETKKLGTSKEQDEMMVCDCVYDKRECGLRAAIGLGDIHVPYCNPARGRGHRGRWEQSGWAR